MKYTKLYLLKNILGLAVLIFIGSIFFSVFKPYEKTRRAINNPLNTLLTNQMSLNLKVTSVVSDRGIAYVELEDSIYVAIPHSRNYNYLEPLLDKFIEKGDILIKAKNSDTLKILRDDKIYYFVIGDFVDN